MKTLWRYLHSSIQHSNEKEQTDVPYNNMENLTNIWLKEEKSDTYTLIHIVWVHLYKVYKQTKLTFCVRSQDSGYFCWEHEESFEML